MIRTPEEEAALQEYKRLQWEGDDVETDKFLKSLPPLEPERVYMISKDASTYFIANAHDKGELLEWIEGEGWAINHPILNYYLCWFYWTDGGTPPRYLYPDLDMNWNTVWHYIDDDTVFTGTPCLPTYGEE